MAYEAAHGVRRSLSAAMGSTAAKVKSLAHHSHGNSSSHQPSSHRSKTLSVTAAGNSTASPLVPLAAASSSVASPQALLLVIMLTTLLVALVLAFVMRKRGHTKISTKEDSLPAAAEDEVEEHMPPSPAGGSVSAARMNRG